MSLAHTLWCRAGSYVVSHISEWGIDTKRHLHHQWCWGNDSVVSFMGSLLSWQMNSDACSLFHTNWQQMGDNVSSTQYHTPVLKTWGILSPGSRYNNHSYLFIILFTYLLLVFLFPSSFFLPKELWYCASSWNMCYLWMMHTDSFLEWKARNKDGRNEFHTCAAAPQHSFTQMIHKPPSLCCCEK